MRRGGDWLAGRRCKFAAGLQAGPRMPPSRPAPPHPYTLTALPSSRPQSPHLSPPPRRRGDDRGPAVPLLCPRRPGLLAQHLAGHPVPPPLPAALHAHHAPCGELEGRSLGGAHSAACSMRCRAQSLDKLLHLLARAPPGAALPPSTAAAPLLPHLPPYPPPPPPYFPHLPPAPPPTPTTACARSSVAPCSPPPASPCTPCTSPTRPLPRSLATTHATRWRSACRPPPPPPWRLACC